MYEYHCPQCAKHFEIIKSARYYDTDEACPSCKTIAVRHFAPSRVYFSGAKVEDAEYNPGLGCIVRSKSHRQELCKIKGLEEIGNETPDTIHKHFDKTREEKRERAWEEADKGWVGDGT